MTHEKDDLLPEGQAGQEDRVEAGDGHGGDDHEERVDVGDVVLAVAGVEDGGRDERGHDEEEHVHADLSGRSVSRGSRSGRVVGSLLGDLTGSDQDQDEPVEVEVVR